MKCFIILYFLTLLALNKQVSSNLSEDDKVAFVLAHNRLRESASPTAAAMRFVQWDDNLHKLAQISSDKCKFEHSEDDLRKNLGENLYKGGSDPRRITLSWFTEKCNYKHEIENKGCRTPHISCGHYEQVMTEGLTRIGCGITKCGDFHIAFCNYDVGTGHYNFGPPCSACPKDAPFCVNNLCVSQKDLDAPVMMKWDKTKTKTCKLACKNCSVRKATVDTCACECKAGTTGDFCQDPKDDGKCSQCTESPACDNGGQEDRSKDPSVCGNCKCTAAFAGDRCDIPIEEFENSVRLTLAALEMIKLADFFVMPPIAKSLLNSNMWPVIQEAMTTAVNDFCRFDAGSLKMCCHSKTWTSGLTEKHVTPSDFKFIPSSVFNNFDNSLSLLIYARSASALCGSTPSAQVVPRALLLKVIESNENAISVALKSCCNGTLATLNATAPSGPSSSPVGSVPICPQKGSSGGAAAKPKKGLKSSSAIDLLVLICLILVASILHF